MEKAKGKFIIFEGIDGSGKTTQISLLKQRIESYHLRCMETREPSEGPIGTLLRQFLSGRLQGEENTIAALFAADRLDHLNNPVNGLCQKIDNGITVLSDRYILSSYAYQSVRMPLEWVKQLNAQACETIRPECHLFIDVDPEVTMQRMATGRFETELFETKERLTEVRNRYLEIIDQLSLEENIIIINGNQSIEAISDEIWSKVCHYFV